MLITMKHVKACGFCSSGVRDYCKNANIDYSYFVKYGIDSKDLPKDVNTTKIINKAKEMEKVNE